MGREMSDHLTEFAPGDVVLLRSGGPAMTVARVYEFNGKILVDVDWFEDRTVHEGRFAPTELTKVA